MRQIHVAAVCRPFDAEKPMAPCICATRLAARPPMTATAPHPPSALVADRGHHQCDDQQQHRAAGAVRGRVPRGRRPAVAAAGRVAAARHTSAAALPAAPAWGAQLRRPAHHIRTRPGERHDNGASRVGRRTYQPRIESIGSGDPHCCQPHLLVDQNFGSMPPAVPYAGSEGAASAARLPAPGFISTW